MCKADASIEVGGLILRENPLLTHQTSTSNKGLFGMFIALGVISAINAAAICALLPCGKHETMLFAVHAAEDSITVLGQSSIFFHAFNAHRWSGFVEGDIFPDGRRSIDNCAKGCFLFLAEQIVRVPIKFAGLSLSTEGSPSIDT